MPAARLYPSVGPARPVRWRAVRIYRRAVFSLRQWSAHPPANQNGWRRQDGEDARSRDHRQTLNPAFATASPTLPAAQDIRGTRENLECKAWWWRCGPLYTPPAQARGISAAPSPLASLLRPAQIRHRLRRSDPADLYRVDPRGSQKKPVQFVERVMTRDP